MARNSALYRPIKSIVGFLFRWLTEMEVIGLENVPLQGGLIIAVNHLSRLDPALVFVLVERDDLAALVADKYRRYPLLRPLIEAVNGIWINREEADFQALREARDFLRRGGALGIAPEGTRSTTRGLIPAKTGVAYLAEKADVPIVPVAISGTETVFAQLIRLRRPQIRIQFGEPFRLPRLDPRRRAASLQENTHEIMCRIAAMLPPAYRGVYADHPCVKERLAESREPVW